MKINLWKTTGIIVGVFTATMILAFSITIIANNTTSEIWQGGAFEPRALANLDWRFVFGASMVTSICVGLGLLFHRFLATLNDPHCKPRH